MTVTTATATTATTGTGTVTTASATTAAGTGKHLLALLATWKKDSNSSTSETSFVGNVAAISIFDRDSSQSRKSPSASDSSYFLVETMDSKFLLLCRN